MRKRSISMLVVVVAAAVLALGGSALAAPTFFFERPCVVEGGIQLTLESSEAIAAGRLTIEASDGTSSTFGAIAADTPVSRTVSQGGTSVLELDGTEVARTFVELEHIQECERPVSLRLGGATRIETAVQISEQRFPGDAEAVYLANATSFVDALPGAPLAFDGPILLVPATTLPTVVGDEIARLQPDHVVVLGGTAAVSNTVLNAALAAAGL